MISLSVKGKYGLAAMVELASLESDLPVQSKVIAESQSIPVNYLEQVLLELKRGGLVVSFRGSQGGYRLARAAEDIVVYDVLMCLEGPSQLCTGPTGCGVLVSYWRDVDVNLRKVFGTRLSELARQKRRMDNQLSYSI
jgi:Rrf2 family transcriptional regulator, cysteine metabolism repressor